eukprot:Nk52_evm14s307 gene=Nk52_evmTU14s307
MSYGGEKGAIATKQQLDELVKSVPQFQRHELDIMLYRFKESLAHPTHEKIDRAKFRDILYNSFEVYDSLLMDRVFRFCDKDNDNTLSFTEWVEGLAIILRGSKEEKLKFCFNVYDLNGDGYISKEEMFQMLQQQGCLVKHSNEEDPDEAIKDLVDIVLKKMDHDRDGRLSFEDYKKTAMEDDLHVEVFGQCMPSDEKIKQFMDVEISSKPKLF